MESIGLSRNVALLGCGYWGKNLARNLHELGALKMVCDPSDAGQAKAREVAPEVDVSPDFEGVFLNEDIKGIAIATPAETHFELAQRALKSGKDVFVEKPLSLNAEQGQRLCQLARQQNRILMVGHLLEYHPAVEHLKGMTETGELGDLRYIYSHRLNFGKIRTEENALWSFAPHDVAVILRLTGKMPQEVHCTGGTYLTSGVADVTMSMLKFESGVRAHIFVSWLNPFKEQKLVVTGSERTAVFDDVAEDKLVIHEQRVDFEDAHPVLRDQGAKTVELPDFEPLRKECQHFINCIENRQQPLTNGESGVRVLKVLEACQKSMDLNGQSVTLDGDK